MTTLTQGLHYTHNGAGQYTIDTALVPVGTQVTLSYAVSYGASWQSALDELGLSLAPGRIGQAAWSWLASYAPTQSLAYSGLAYVYAEAYPLTNQAEIENHSFEVISGHSVSSTVPDCWPDRILKDFLVYDTSSIGWREGRLAPMTQLVNYTRARQLWLSVAMSEQKPAREWMEGLAKICNAEWIWQGGLLDLIPRADEAISSSYGSFTPVTTPVFDLVHGEGGDILEPVEVEPRVNEDAFNIIKIEWTNRANGYAIEIMTASDAAHIELFGERPKDVQRMHEIHDPAVAQGVAQQLLQREMTVWNRYTFKVPFSRALMGLMDLATLTDADSALDRAPVRILERNEAGHMQYTYTAEDAAIGSASAPLYGSQGGAGFGHDYNAAPGNVLAPAIFEAPTELTSTGLEVYAAVTGSGADWGGCRVWVSLDGLNYKDMGRLYGGSRYGTLTASMATSGNAAVQLVGQGGQMLAGSSQDAAALSTLCWAAGIDGGEYFAHQGASLTAPNAYTLSGLVRGAYQNTVQAHSSGAAFVRVDQAIAKSGPLTDEMIGQTLRFKFTSFNVYGGGEQSLADAVEYTYAVTGAQLLLPPRPFDVFTVLAQPDGTRQFNFSYTGLPPPDWQGGEIRYTTDLAATNWAAMLKLQDDPTFYTNSPAETNQPIEGSYRFACRSRDRWGALSSARYVNIDLPKRRTGRVFDEYFEHVESWPGTLGSMVELYDTPSTTILEATDSGTWDALTTWDAWTGWNMSPASPCSYTGAARDLGTVLAGQVDATIAASGTAVIELRTSANGSSWSAWGSISAPFTNKWIQVRVTLTATGGEPVPALREFSYTVTADVKREYINDQVISAYTGGNRIGTGDIRIPLQNNYSVIKRIGVVIQDSSAGTWSWQRIDNTLTGPRVQFKLAGTLTDPAFVDFDVEGI